MILYQDQLIPEDQVHISIRDRGYYFGDGVYEVFRVYQGHLYEADAHLERLQKSAEAIRLNLPYPIKQLSERIKELVRQNRLVDGTVYLQITRGKAERTFQFPEKSEPVLTAYCTPVARPLEKIKSGISAVTVRDIRWHRCDIKSLNLLGAVLAKQEALDRGADEAILHRDGTVTEGSSCNVMVVKDGTLYTHPADQAILHGITRAVVLRLANILGIDVRETKFGLDMLMEADEVFITGTTVEITPVVKVDGRTVGRGKPGPVTQRLQEAFEKTLPK